MTDWHQVDGHVVLGIAAEAQPWTPRPGDVVRLKSGGPDMTVEICNDDQEACCSWFDASGFSQRFFPAACLTPAKEGQP